MTGATCCILCRQDERYVWSTQFGSYVRKCRCGERVIRAAPVVPTMTWGKSKTKRVDRLCTHCAELFLALPNSRQRYCSRSCGKAEWRDSEAVRLRAFAASVETRRQRKAASA